jgi:hypothetical protein
MKFGSVRVDENLAFKSAFGNITPDRDGYRYVDYFRGIDQRGKLFEDIKKTRDTTTDTYALTPIYPSREIIDIARRKDPLWELFPKVAITQRTFEFNQLTDYGTSVGRFLGESGTLVGVDATYYRQSKPVKFAYATGGLTGPAIKTEYLTDPLAEEVRVKVLGLTDFLDQALINADSTSHTVPYGDGSTEQSWEGLTELLGSTNRVDAGPAAVTIDKIREAIRNGIIDGGDPSLLVTDFATLDSIKGLLMSYQRFVDKIDLAWGAKTVEFDGLPLIGDSKMPTGSNAKRLFALDMEYAKVGVLQDITYEPLAKTSDIDSFMLKFYGVPVLQAIPFNGHIYQIA